MNHEIDQYFDLDHQSTSPSTQEMPSENEDSNELMFESPFQSNEDSLEFMVLPNTGYAPPKNLFLGLFFTIIIAVFVVPESGGAVFIGQA